MLESQKQNILSWKWPTRTTESNSCLWTAQPQKCSQHSFIMFFLMLGKMLLFLRMGNLKQPEYRHGKRVWSCRWAHRLLNAVADHSRGYVCEITMPSIIIIILRIYNVEKPTQINKQTISSWGDTDTQFSQGNQREWICISKKQLSSP